MGYPRKPRRRSQIAASAITAVITLLALISASACSNGETNPPTENTMSEEQAISSSEQAVDMIVNHAAFVASTFPQFFDSDAKDWTANRICEAVADQLEILFKIERSALDLVVVNDRCSDKATAPNCSVSASCKDETMTLTLKGSQGSCRGPVGFQKYEGSLELTYAIVDKSGSPGKELRITLKDGGDLKINDNPTVWDTTVSLSPHIVTYDENERPVINKEDGSIDVAIEQTLKRVDAADSTKVLVSSDAKISVVYTLGDGCMEINGEATGEDHTVVGTTNVYAATVKDFKICNGNCPEAGGTIDIKWTGVWQYEAKFDGTTVMQVRIDEFDNEGDEVKWRDKDMSCGQPKASSPPPTTLAASDLFGKYGCTGLSGCLVIETHSDLSKAKAQWRPSGGDKAVENCSAAIELGLETIGMKDCRFSSQSWMVDLNYYKYTDDEELRASYLYSPDVQKPRYWFSYPLNCGKTTDPNG
jgi:hypothetical protein